MASRIRRKPQVTYKSPSAEDHAFITLSSTYSRSKPSSTTPKSAPPSTLPNYPHDIQGAGRPKYSMTPSLPLFHPFGRLAMSLPPLDPTLYGLPMPAIPDEIEPRASSRARRPAAKSREVEEVAPSVSPTVSTIAAVAAREAKERPSPRKRRTGGAKRKRKDADDGDATYPAKRTRMPRGVANQGVEEDALLDVAQPNEAEIIPETLPELSDTAKRRSTRSRGSLKRRDSSASETTSISGTPHAIASGNTGGTDTTLPSNITDVEMPPKKDSEGADQLIENNDKEEKEEGELSEEQPNP